MSNSTCINGLRKEIEALCDNCDRPDKEQLGELILSSMALGFSVGLEAPSADRPQGEWIDIGGYEVCKNCHEVKRFPHWNFCPYCGADMRKGADDETD